jgi:FkbM family methyltransferase
MSQIEQVDRPQTRTICGYPFTLYSQPETAQDEWVIRKLRGKERGFFIEIGAFDGVYHSNTLTLERELHWNGILIEADPFQVRKARANRTAHVLARTLAPEGCIIESFYIAGQWSGLRRFMRPSLIAGHKTFRNTTRAMPTITLQQAIGGLEVPEIVDYLSIDVEGAEYPILESYFKSPDARRFRCMTVEVGEQQDDLDKLLALLRPLGYRLDRVCEWEAYFTNPELLP